MFIYFLSFFINFCYFFFFFFFFNDTATTEIYTLSLHDALPTWRESPRAGNVSARGPRILEDPLHKTLLLSINALYASVVWAQAPSPPSPQTKLSVHWEELSAAEFRDAIGRARGTCLLP